MTINSFQSLFDCSVVIVISNKKQMMAGLNLLFSLIRAYAFRQRRSLILVCEADTRQEKRLWFSNLFIPSIVATGRSQPHCLIGDV